MELTEYVDKVKATNLSRHPALYEQDQNLLASYANNIINDKIKIAYKQRLIDGEPFGRYLPEPFVYSSIYQWNAVRATLFSGSDYDVDIVNAQPNIFLGYVQELEEEGHVNESEYQRLAEYCMDRDAVFEMFTVQQEAIERYNRDNQDNLNKKGVLKKLFTRILFGGRLDRWLHDFNFNASDVSIPDWFNEFQQEMIYLAKQVVKHHKKRQLAIKKYQDKHGEKADINYQKILALLLQDKEAEITYQAITYLKGEGFEITSYNYDGFQIRKDERIHQYLSKIGDDDFNCRFIIKPFSDALDYGEIKKTAVDIFDSVSFDRIGLRWQCDETVDEHNDIKTTYTPMPTSRTGMQEKKKYFEKYFALLTGSQKILKVSGGRHFILSTNANGIAFKNMHYFVDTKDSVIRKPFFHWWLEQPDLRQADMVANIPPPRPVPDNVFNTWQGFPIEKEPLNLQADFTPLLEHIKNICGNCDKSYEYVLNWFAHKIQYPGRKIGVALVLFSREEGTGKTTIAEGIMKGFLQERAMTDMIATDDSKKIFSRFSNAGEKILVVFNEANLKDISSARNQMKSFITDETFHKEMKGIDSELVPNVADCIFTSNNDNCVVVGENDRRFMILHADAGNANNTDYFKPVHTILGSKSHMRHFYEFLKKRDISEWKPEKDRVKGKIYEEFKVNTRPMIIDFWVQFYDKFSMNNQFWNNLKTGTGDERHKFLTTDYLYSQYKLFMKVNGKETEFMTQTKFLQETKNNILKGIVSARRVPNGPRGLKFDDIPYCKWYAEHNTDQEKDDNFLDLQDDEGTDVGELTEEECDDI